MGPWRRNRKWNFTMNINRRKTYRDNSSVYNAREQWTIIYYNIIYSWKWCIKKYRSFGELCSTYFKISLWICPNHAYVSNVSLILEGGNDLFTPLRCFNLRRTTTGEVYFYIFYPEIKAVEKDLRTIRKGPSRAMRHHVYSPAVPQGSKLHLLARREPLLLEFYELHVPRRRLTLDCVELS